MEKSLMNHTCIECKFLACKINKVEGIFIVCKKGETIRDIDSWYFIQNDNSCNKFESNTDIILGPGRKLSGSREGDELIKYIIDLGHSPIIGSSIRNSTVAEGTSRFWKYRESNILELSDDDLPRFKDDKLYKGYDLSNQFFADLLVSCRFSIPIIFWMNRLNRPGAKHYAVISTQGPYHVIALGKYYNTIQLSVAIAKALKMQRIRITATWFLNAIKNFSLST